MFDERLRSHQSAALLTLRRGLCAAVVLGVLCGQTPRAYAQDDTAQAKAHYVKGKQHLQAGQLEDAIREFKKAYLLKRIPAILFNIAQVYRKLGDAPMALHFLEKFVAEAPANDPNRKEAKAIVDELRAAGTAPSEKPQPAAEPEPAPPPTPPPPRVVRGRDTGDEPPPPPRKRKRMKRVDAFTHEAVDEVPPDLPMDVACQVPEVDGMRVTLFYRVAGQESFTPVIMKDHNGEYVGRIPARHISGKSLQYYIEARDGKGKSIGSSGTAANPNIILIAIGAKKHYDMNDSENTTDFVVGPKPKPRPDPNAKFEGRDYRVWKWTTAVVALALVGGGAGAYVYAGQQADALAKAAQNRNGSAPGRQFDQKLRDIQSSGKLNMMLGTVAIVGAAVVAGGSVTLFIFDESGKREALPASASARRPLRAFVAPVITPDGFAVSGMFQF